MNIFYNSNIDKKDIVTLDIYVLNVKIDSSNLIITLNTGKSYTVNFSNYKENDIISLRLNKYNDIVEVSDNEIYQSKDGAFAIANREEISSWFSSTLIYFWVGPGITSKNSIGFISYFIFDRDNLTFDNSSKYPRNILASKNKDIAEFVTKQNNTTNRYKQLHTERCLQALEMQVDVLTKIVAELAPTKDLTAFTNYSSLDVYGEDKSINFSSNIKNKIRKVQNGD